MKNRSLPKHGRFATFTPMKSTSIKEQCLEDPPADERAIFMFDEELAAQARRNMMKAPSHYISKRATG
jgi:hypothetical protein